jgi:hypothetical protein
MTYDNSYPFINEALNGKKKEAKENGNSSVDFTLEYNRMKEKAASLQAEKRHLEERRDALKVQVSTRTRTEDEIRDVLFKSFMNTIWNVYKNIEKNNIMELNLRKKEETYEQEYSQLMDEIASLMKEKNGTAPIFNKDQR